jgi:excisionase family DNA binding protein
LTEFVYSKLLNLKEAATYLDISIPTLGRRLAERELGFYKLGRRVVISERQLQAYLEKREVAPSDTGI